MREAREWTWLSHRGNGFRIDHAFATKAFVVQAKPACRHDHAPRETALSDQSGLIVTAARKWRPERITPIYAKTPARSLR
jgi:hypothetical protein